MHIKQHLCKANVHVGRNVVAFYESSSNVKYFWLICRSLSSTKKTESEISGSKLLCFAFAIKGA